jgi:hypothetical protein
VFDYSPWQKLDYTSSFNTQYLPIGLP